MRPGTVSVMPAGLDQQLSPQEMADLIAFLKSRSKVSGPARKAGPATNGENRPDPARGGRDDEPERTGEDPSRGSWLAKLGLDRPELRAWAMYDWANSAMVTRDHHGRVPDLLFGASHAQGIGPRGAHSRLFAIATTIGMAIIAVLSPVLGTMADSTAVKKEMLGGFLAIGRRALSPRCSSSTQGDWVLASALFIAGQYRGQRQLCLLRCPPAPHRPHDDEVDRVSTAGYALGYLGGGLLLALNLAWISQAGLVRIALGPGPHARRRSRFPRGWRSSRSPSGGWSSRSRSSAASPSRRSGGFPPGYRGSEAFPIRRGVRPAGRDVPRPGPIPPGRAHADRVPDLQRRHRHDHAHGRRSTPTELTFDQGVDDRLDHAGAVRRDPVRVPVRHAGRADRGQAVDRAGAGRLRGICVVGYFMTNASGTSSCWPCWWGRCRGARRR